MKQKIAIHSVPRSGSSWLGSIFDSSPRVLYRYQPLFSYAHKGQIRPDSNKKMIEEFFENIKNSNDDFILQKEEKRKGLVPEFIKKNPTHIAYKEVRYHHILQNLLEKDNDIKIIGLVRNPFAVINSWLKAPKEFKKELGWKISEEWFYAPKKNQNKPEEFNGFDKWIEVTNMFLELKKTYPERFYILNYSKLVENRLDQVKALFSFCRINLEQQTLDFLTESKQKQIEDAYTVYKRKLSDNSWMEELPDHIRKAIQHNAQFKEINKIFKWNF